MSTNNPNEFNDNNGEVFSPEETFSDNNTFNAGSDTMVTVPANRARAGKWLLFGVVLLGVGGYLSYQSWLHRKQAASNPESGLPPLTTGQTTLPSAPLNPSSTMANTAPTELSRKARVEQQFAATQKAALANSSPLARPKAETSATNAMSTNATPAPTTMASQNTTAASPVLPKILTPLSQSVQPQAQAQAQAQSQSQSQQTSTVDGTLSLLNDRLAKQLEQMQNVEDALQKITDTVAKLNDDVHAMDNRILALSGSTTSLTSELGSLKRDFGQVKRSLSDEGIDFAVPTPPSHSYTKSSLYRPSNAMPVNPMPPYVVHAIIPGRAWLKGPDGQILTITEGDTLGDFGKVLVIDAASGMVLTQSGVTFK